MNAFLRASAKMVGGLSIMALYMMVMFFLMSVAEKHFNTIWAGFIVAFSVPLALIWYFTYQSEKAKDEWKDL